MFSCEFFEVFKNAFFTEHLQTTASVNTKNSFKTEQRNHQEMLYVICDLPISDISWKITWKFNKILQRKKPVKEFLLSKVAGLQLKLQD